MTLTVTPCTDPELWDRTVIDLGGHPLQLWGWGELKSAHRWSAERVLVTRDGETVGACQLLTRKLPWPLGGFVYAPRGPVLARGPKAAEIEGATPGSAGAPAQDPAPGAVADAVADYVRRTRRAVAVSIEPDEDDGRFPLSAGWRRAETTVLPARTLILDLTRSEDELMGDMSKKHRQYVRKSEREESIEIRRVETAEQLEECLEVYRATSARADFGLHEDSYYHDARTMLGEHAPIWASYVDGKPVAFLFLAVSGRTSFELYGGMDETGQRLRANYALKWNAIREMKARGVERYDFGGLINDGVTTFKTGFSSHENLLAGTWDRPMFGYGIWTRGLPLAKSVVRKLPATLIAGMGHSRAEAAYQRAIGAFKNPTLDLLHGRYAPFVIAALSLVFTADRPTVAVSDAHVEVGEIVDELRAADHDGQERGLPAGSGREICRYWVRVGWLVPQIVDDVEVYRLSAQAVGALEIAGRAGGGRSRVSRSRVRTLLETIEQLAQDAEPDPEERRARLLSDRAAIDAELARLEEHGAPEPADDELLLEEAENVLHLARELPADFSRVAESINAMQRDVVADLRRDVRPAGEVLREYLQRGQHVMQATPEGRAFAGALRLIGDPERIDHLTDQLRTLLAQPFSRLMDAEQRSDLDAIAKRVEQGVQEVLTAQRRASHVITAQVRTHDPARDREVDELLRSVMSGLQNWTRDAKAGDRVEPLRGFPVAGVGHLRQTLSDIRPPAAPAPLREAESEAEFEDVDTRAWGGPRYTELEAYVAGLGERFDLADAFAGAPDADRRPVDLLGLLEIAHRTGMSEGDEVSVVEALRPDGTSRRFAFGSVTAGIRTEPAVPEEGEDD